ncbi:MAG: flagellar hook assembly protein FlgD [Alphaproteobacteria bacterium]|nr:flagellar hook assembly protein FlgD [Alphaproteobacteria bacterium]
MSTIGSATDTTTATGTTKSMSKLAENFDQFLTLLTTQLKNQDPLSPMDSAQFTQQLVSFAGVEQQINTNKNLESLLSLQKTNQMVGALDLMGKTVEAKTDQIPLVGGSGTFAYSLPQTASKVAYAIADSSGRVVYSGTGDTEAGRHEYTWDGKSTGGVKQPDGAYTLSVAALDKNGALIDVTTTAIGKVSGVESGDTSAVLAMGAVKVPVDQLTAVIN